MSLVTGKFSILSKIYKDVPFSDSSKKKKKKVSEYEITLQLTRLLVYRPQGDPILTEPDLARVLILFVGCWARNGSNFCGLPPIFQNEVQNIVHVKKFIFEYK